MKLLLDTHVAIWAILGDPRLPEPIEDMLLDARNDVIVSVASVWEIAIKKALSRAGQGAIPLSAKEAVRFFLGAGYSLLSVSADHAMAIEELAPLHGDPFDRLLVALALTEPLRLITHDPKVAAYSDSFVYF